MNSINQTAVTKVNPESADKVTIASKGATMSHNDLMRNVRPVKLHGFDCFIAWVYFGGELVYTTFFSEHLATTWLMNQLRKGASK